MVENLEENKEQLTGAGETTHKRRKRYSGTHPRTFAEKYKEHNPEKYADTVAKVISKGSTPAGMHISIMVKEVLDVLKIQPGEVGLDATLGYGGHSRKMMEQLKGEGHLYSLDVDPIEIVKTRKRLNDAGYGDDIFTAISENFVNIDKVADLHGPFNFLMADLGVSSMQIDNPERGFSYKLEGELDLRLNPEKGIPAWQRLKEMNREEIIGMFEENSDEPYAERIANILMNRRKKGIEVRTTSELKSVIEEGLGISIVDGKLVSSLKEINAMSQNDKKDLIKKTCQRVFQAIRIDVNSEFEVLEGFLSKLPDVMAKGGRVAILTFHSGEDRLVKRYFKEYARAGIFSSVSTDVIRPSQEECRANGRARSTKLRWAIK